MQRNIRHFSPGGKPIPQLIEREQIQRPFVHIREDAELHQQTLPFIACRSARAFEFTLKWVRLANILMLQNSRRTFRNIQPQRYRYIGRSRTNQVSNRHVSTPTWKLTLNTLMNNHDKPTGDKRKSMLFCLPFLEEHGYDNVKLPNSAQGT
ncbi:hypothetical protein O9993_01380 [Vibrio lentus]|nr:hypothetical protein [Vibrio lentus]